MTPSIGSHRRWWRAVAPVVVGASAVGGCGTETTPSSLDPAGPESRSLETLWWVLLGMATAVFVVVLALIVWAALSRRHETNPGRWSDTRLIVVGGIVLPAIVLAVVGVLTVSHIADVRAEPGSDALQVEVVGHDWWWEVRYPDLDITSANEIHLPVDRDIEVTLRSDDVIHSLWIPQLGGKTDLVPGQTNHMRLRADRAGTFTATCAEFCGLQHTKMLFFAIAQSPRDFDHWVEAHRVTPAPVGAAEGRGSGVFERQACGACHAVAGTDAPGGRGPDLTDVGSRHRIGAGVLENTAAGLARWITDNQQVKEGNLMPDYPMAQSDLDDLVAYLQSLR
jgi:cytochrome c oxidase subunit II